MVVNHKGTKAQKPTETLRDVSNPYQFVLCVFVPLCLCG
jgi:hypothetical protein